MMPSDFTNPLDPPPLCAFHGTVIRNLTHLDHVDDRDSTRAAHQIARQCPTCLERTEP
jgi:hypothetical protein